MECTHRLRRPQQSPDLQGRLEKVPGSGNSKKRSTSEGQWWDGTWRGDFGGGLDGPF